MIVQKTRHQMKNVDRVPPSIRRTNGMSQPSAGRLPPYICQLRSG